MSGPDDVSHRGHEDGDYPGRLSLLMPSPCVLLVCFLESRGSSLFGLPDFFGLYDLKFGFGLAILTTSFQTAAGSAATNLMLKHR